MIAAAEIANACLKISEADLVAVETAIIRGVRTENIDTRAHAIVIGDHNAIVIRSLRISHINAAI